MSSLDSFGLGPTGLATPRMADFQSALQSQWQAAFGSNVNLDPRSNNGQLITIMAERFALLAELLEGIYNSSYPAGAEGVAVDNLLSLQGLTRLQASATITAPSAVTSSNGVTLYGLVCYGTAGTNIPAGSLISDSASPVDTFAIDNAVTIGTAQNAVQTLAFLQSPTSGTFDLVLTSPSGVPYTLSGVSYDAQGNQSIWTWSPVPTDGTFSFTIGTQTKTLTFDASTSQLLTGSQVAAALNTMLSTSSITGSGDASTQIFIQWNGVSIPSIVFGSSQAPNVKNPLQYTVNHLQDASGNNPFADVAITRTANVFSFAFGAATASVAPTAAQAIPLLTIARNGLFASQMQVNVQVANQVAGHAAQAIASATCNQTGPVSVTAGQITQIVTPVAGWTSVVNQLDCITGSNAETDTEALARRATLVANQAQGPLAAILQRVEGVSGVTSAVAIVNSSLAAQQIVRVANGSTSGSFTLYLNGNSLVLPYNVTASAMQSQIRAIAGFETVVVQGDPINGLVVDWQSSQGGQSVPLMVLGANSTGVAVSVDYGRYPKSVEIVAEGGSNTDVAQAIFAAAPAGLASYGSPLLVTTANVTAGQSTITVADTTGLVIGLGVVALGVPQGALIASIAKNTITLTASALSTYSTTKATFLYAVPIADASGNAQIVQFSRPQVVPIYANVVLKVDTYQVPGDASSGVNPRSQWSVGSIATIQARIKAAVDLVGIGGQLVATGTNGIANSFRDVAGVDDATVYFGYTADTTNQSRLQLLAEQVPDLELNSIVVSVP